MNLTQRAVIRYLDGTKAEATLTQWSMGQWAVFCSRQGIKFDPSEPGLLVLVMLRYQAWAELHRVRGPNAIVPSFDAWDMTVEEVETPDEPQEVFPTVTEPSDV